MSRQETLRASQIPEVPLEHVVFLHEKLSKDYDDRYLVDLATAMRSYGHPVTINTSEFDENDCLQELDPVTSKLAVNFSGWWLPNSVFGRFTNCMVRIKSAWRALRLVFLPPKPKPAVIFVDGDVAALPILYYLTRSKVVYLHNFPQLQETQVYHESLKIMPDLFTAKALKCAHKIIVRSEELAVLFKRSFPSIKKEIHICYPCVDTGYWKQQITNIHRIVPDIPKKPILFVVFGEYRRRSNFRLALDALEQLLLMIENDSLRQQVHMVIAGHCSERSVQQKIFYTELLQATKEKMYASNVTFLRQLPTVHMKTLIEKSVAVVHPMKHDFYSAAILAAMNLGRPIIATNTGFAAEVLIHRLSGILIAPDSGIFAAAMYKIMLKPTLQGYLGDMAKEKFRVHYSYDSLTRKLNKLISDLTNDFNNFN